MTRLYTAKEASEQLGKNLSEHTIRGMCKRGEVEFVEGARRAVLLTQDQIDQLVAARTRAPRPQTPPEYDEPDDNVFGATELSHTRHG